MATIYLVRHGQASFGAANYDQLSDLGRLQAERLGAYWRHAWRDADKDLWQSAHSRNDHPFDAVFMGSLARHRQTWEGIARGAELPSKAAEVWPELNEYDSRAVMLACNPEPISPVRSPEEYRAYFGRLRQALLAWMTGQTQPEGMPSFADFSGGLVRVLEHIRKEFGTSDARVLVVSSGGPIATLVSQILATPADSTIELNMRIRNTGVTELACTPKRCSLQTFNSLPHLHNRAALADLEEEAKLITYA